MLNFLVYRLLAKEHNVAKTSKKSAKKDVYYIDIERDEKRKFVFSDVIESKVTQAVFNKYFKDEDNIITINRLPTKSKIVIMSSDEQCAEACHLGLTIKDELPMM